MPLVFVHGVNVRKATGDESYDNWVRFRNQNFLRFLYNWPPDPNGLFIELGKYLRAPRREIFNPYWGDCGAGFKFNYGALPKGDAEKMGLEDENTMAIMDILGRDERAPINDPTRILPIVGQRSLDDVIDLIWACFPTPETEEQANDLSFLTALAALYTERNPHPRWLTSAYDNDEVAKGLMDDLAELENELTASESPSEEERYGGKGSKAFSFIMESVGGLAGNAAKGTENLLFWRWARNKLRPTTMRFMGDVMTYLNKRGTRGNEGSIVKIVSDDLLAARKAKPLDSSDKLIVIAHSMGGNIVYDILTHFQPSLEVDLFITVGSQVGLFEELSLFRSSTQWVHGDQPPAQIKKPDNIVEWFNIYDPMDPVAFAVEQVFTGTHDLTYDTGVGLVLSHTHYFKHPKFYKRLAKRL